MNNSERFDGFTDRARRGALARVHHVILTLLVMCVLVAAVYGLNIPNPNIVLCVGLTAMTAQFGYPSGIAGGLVMAVYSMFFFSENHSFFIYTSQNLYKLTVIVLSVAAEVLLVGRLKARHDQALHRLAQANAALRMDNESLTEANATDPLTGVRNRWAIRRDYSRYENRYVHVMMLDLDEYKQLNDTYGHAVGDYILRQVGAGLKEVFGLENSYRYGGDEFLVICAELAPDPFAARVARLRDMLGDIYVGEKRLPVRFSAGSVYGDCEHSDDLRLMMHQADYNLYEVKRQGGNRAIDTEYNRRTAKNLERITTPEGNIVSAP